MNWPVILEGLVSGGFFTGIFGLIKALMGKRKVKVDSAEVVQGMALSLIAPFESRLKSAEAEVDRLQAKIRALNAELDRALAGRRAAESALLQHGLPIPLTEGA